MVPSIKAISSKTGQFIVDVHGVYVAPFPKVLVAARHLTETYIFTPTLHVHASQLNPSPLLITSSYTLTEVGVLFTVCHLRLASWAWNATNLHISALDKFIKSWYGCRDLRVRCGPSPIQRCPLIQLIHSSQSSKLSTE
jgi:hypothetical protein